MENRIMKIALEIMEIQDEDISEIEDIIEQQKTYDNPLRMATTAQQNQLAIHNQRVLDKILELRDIIAEGDNIPTLDKIQRDGMDFQWKI